MRALNSPLDDLEAAALESSRKSPAKCISIMTAGWELPLRKWTVRWWQNVFCTEAISLKRPRKTPIAQISKPSLCHNPEEDLACAQAVTKYATKEMWICYFLGHVNLMATKKEMKEPFQASVQGISGSRRGRRAGQPQEESLLSVIYTKTTGSICKPD